MKTQKNQKREYVSPGVKRIKLDKEISLVMQSPTDAPSNPTWGKNDMPESIQDPFKNENSYC